MFCSYFANVAQNGFPEKYLKKNNAYWCGYYYLPEYTPYLLLATGVACIAFSKSSYKISSNYISCIGIHFSFTGFFLHFA